RYNTTFDDKTAYAPGKAPRPILVNLWYPASPAAGAKRMPHRDYLGIRSDDPLLARFSAKLAEYERAVITKEVMGRPEAELTRRRGEGEPAWSPRPAARVRPGRPAGPGAVPGRRLPRRRRLVVRGQLRVLRVPGGPRVRRPRQRLSEARREFPGPGRRGGVGP